MVKIPNIITQDRSEICDIISAMLDHANEYGIYPTAECYNKMEKLLNKVRLEAIGWAWSEACVRLDIGQDPREYDMDNLVARGPKELNKPWVYKEKEG